MTQHITILGHALFVSVVITAIYGTLQKGMFFSHLRALSATWMDRSAVRLLGETRGRKWSLYVQKPLWGCLPCMSSVWTCLLSMGFDIWLILAVCGLNFMIDKYLDWE